MSDSNFSDFGRWLLSDIAASLGVPYDALTRDFAALARDAEIRATKAHNTIMAVADPRVVSWHGEDEITLDDPHVRGWLGGVWRDDPPWDEYLAGWADAADRARLIALKDHLVATSNKRGGAWHQREGIPRFSDGTYLYMSMRAWGDLQAAIWGGHYCHYAWED